MRMAKKIRAVMEKLAGPGKTETEQRAYFVQTFSISHAYLSQMLTGQREPSKKLIKAISDKVNLPMSYFFDDVILDRNDDYFIYHAKLDEATAAGLTEEQIKFALDMAIQMLKQKTPPK